MTKATAARDIDRTPIAFKVLTPIFFRGEPVAAGTILKVELIEAVDLFGNVRVELVTNSDWMRIRDQSRASAGDPWRAAQAKSGWVHQYSRA